MDNNKRKILMIFAISVLMIALVGATFAYFTAQGGGTTSRNVRVTSNTTDLLTFQVANDITFTASTANFYQGGSNVSGSTTSTATLVPNNNTNQATMNYYMYLNLTSNPTVYSTGNTNEDAELVLQVFDGNNQLVTLTGLGDQVAIGSSYGYDITGKTGLITLLNNHAISANGSTTTENWSVVITLVNLNIDQNDNTNKTVTGEVIMQKDAIIFGPSATYYWRLLYEASGADNGLYPTPTDSYYPSFLQLDDMIADYNLYLQQNNYGWDFDNEPIYIKTEVYNNSEVIHYSCVHDSTNNRDFCFNPDSYWTCGDDYDDELECMQESIPLLSQGISEQLGITVYNTYEQAEAAGSNNYCEINHLDHASCYFYLGDAEMGCYIDGDDGVECIAMGTMCYIEDDRAGCGQA